MSIVSFPTRLGKIPMGLPVSLILGFLLSACAPTFPDPQAPEDSPSTPTSPSPPSPDPNSAAIHEPVILRVIYVIHGDADYTWHDSSGRRLFADREALRQALYVAENARGTEVFIFHQRTPKSRFFSREPEAGTFYHYRSGSILGKRNYSYTAGMSYLQPEADILIHETDSSQAPSRSMLVYFGHEIPLADQSGYFASDPDMQLSATRFTQSMSKLKISPPSLTTARKPFDLVVLSTCYGGNPAMMKALAPLADQAIASPAYLHLSFLNTRAIVDFTRGFSWDTLPNPSVGVTLQNMRNLADTIAAQSFIDLKKKTQTEITVGIYNLEKVKPFLASSVSDSQISWAATTGRSKTPHKTRDWKDCAGDPAFDSSQAAAGVNLFYQPPRFGLLKDQSSRSAWECLL